MTCVCPNCGNDHRDARASLPQKPAQRRKIIMDALTGQAMTTRELEAYTGMPWNQLHSNVDVLRRQGKIKRNDDDRWVMA